MSLEIIESNIRKKRELATTLAALRLWQSALANDVRLPSELNDIATGGGFVEPLTIEEIDTLCEKINVP